MGQRGTSCLRCHILGLRCHIIVYIGRQYGPIVPGQHHWPPITPTGGGDGTKGDILPRMPYTCVHRQTIRTNCPRPAPLATNNPYRGGRDGTKGDIFSKLAYIPKKNLGTTTKCSSLKGLRTINISLRPLDH